MVESISPTLLFIVGQIILAAGIWGAIRADLKNMHRRQDSQEENMKQAHSRIDQLFQVYWQNTPKT